jgi:hypothetical protein
VPQYTPIFVASRVTGWCAHIMEQHANNRLIRPVWKIKTLGAALEITNKRTVERRGLFSKATSEVVHDNIRNVQVDQTFWQRVWKVGALGLSSSGQDGIEIHMQHVPKPEEVRRIIDLYRPL